MIFENNKIVWPAVKTIDLSPYFQRFGLHVLTDEELAEQKRLEAQRRLEMELTQKELLQKNKELIEAQILVSNNRHEIEQNQLNVSLARINAELAKLSE